MRNLVIKDISLESLKELSNDYIEHRMLDNFELHDKLTNIEVIESEEKVLVDSFIRELVLLKYQDIDYDDYFSEDADFKELSNIYSIKLIENKLSRMSKECNESFIVDHNDRLDPPYAKRYMFKLIKLDAKNMDVLLENYRAKLYNHYFNYDDLNLFTQNDYINMKNVMSDLSVNPVYSYNYSKFKLSFNNLISNSIRQIVFNNDNLKVDASSFYVHMSNDLTNIHHLKAHVTHLVLDKYFNIKHRAKEIDSGNTTFNLKEMLINKIFVKDIDEEPKDENTYINFSYSNLDYIFENLDLEKDKYKVEKIMEGLV